MDTRRLSAADLPSLRMSVAAARSLPADQIGQLLDELEDLLRERERLAAVVTELQAGPWPEVRRLLAELHRSLGTPPPRFATDNLPERHR